MLQTNSYSLFALLPFEIIREILLYDNRFVIRKKHNSSTLIWINKIVNLDQRCLLLETIPKIYELSTNSWSVILGKHKKFVLGHYLRPSNIWEYRFVTFYVDQHSNMMCSIPDSAIYTPL